MSDPTPGITYIYDGWRESQEMLVRWLAPLPSEAWALATAPGQWSVAGIVAHIVLVRAGWMRFTLGVDDARLATVAQWQEADPPAAADLLQGLASTWDVMAESILQYSPAQMAEQVEDSDSQGNTWMLSRGWVVWHLLEHDLLHAGEVSAILGMHGHAAGAE
jgi:uncharacterized damage-inducible protein DinB